MAKEEKPRIFIIIGANTESVLEVTNSSNPWEIRENTGKIIKKGKGKSA